MDELAQQRRTEADIGSSGIPRRAIEWSEGITNLEGYDFDAYPGHRVKLLNHLAAFQP
jgi:hypothetical protein